MCFTSTEDGKLSKNEKNQTSSMKIADFTRRFIIENIVACVELIFIQKCLLYHYNFWLCCAKHIYYLD